MKLLDKGLISLEILEEMTIEVEDLPDLYGGYDQLWPEGDYVVILYANPFSSISKEAREVAAEKYGSTRRKKIAFVSNNLANILIVKLFKSFNKPQTAINIFRKEEDAFEWLRKKELHTA